MTKEALLAKLHELPTIKFGTVPLDKQVIKGSEGSIRYKMTKECRPSVGLILCTLQVIGPMDDRKNFILKLANALGDPWLLMNSPDMPGIAHLAFWEASVLDRRLKK